MRFIERGKEKNFHINAQSIYVADEISGNVESRQSYADLKGLEQWVKTD